MSSKRYTEEFKIEAVKQITERRYSVQSVASRLVLTKLSDGGWRRNGCFINETGRYQVRGAGTSSG